MAETAKTMTYVDEEFRPGAYLWLGTQSMPWRVLDIAWEAETALLISEKPVSSRAYKKNGEDTTWEQCDIREWLNGEYFEKIFSAKEKEAILECELKNLDNTRFGTKGGNDTKDRVFLLSIEEAEKYFKDDKDRATGSAWWLRSPGHCSKCAAIVCPDGRVVSLGGNVFDDYFVHPAIKINLKSDFFHSFISSQSPESIIINIPELYIKNGTAIGVLPFIKDVVIPESVTSVGKGAFAECSGITSITIPESVMSIGEDAFVRCSSLTSVLIPNSVTSIGNWAFMGCSSLTRVTIPNSVTSIGDWAFSDSSSLTSVTIPNSVMSIGNWAFSGCSSLTSVTIPNSVTSIGESAFKECSSLRSVTIPNSVTSIGKDVFQKCSGLASITIPESVTSIGEGAFKECSSLTSVVIPKSVTSIAYAAFYNCRSLKSVTIPESVTSIGDAAFYGCSSLTSMTIPKNVRRIGYVAFAGCRGLKTLTLLCKGVAIEAESVNGLSGNCVIAAYSIPLSMWKKEGLGIHAARGFIAHFSEYSDQTIIDEYIIYISSRRKRLLPVIFEEDQVEVLRLLAEAKKIKRKKDYLLPAMQSKAEKCTDYLKSLFPDVAVNGIMQRRKKQCE